MGTLFGMIVGFLVEFLSRRTTTIKKRERAIFDAGVQAERLGFLRTAEETERIIAGINEEQRAARR